MQGIETTGNMDKRTWVVAWINILPICNLMKVWSQNACDDR